MQAEHPSPPSTPSVGDALRDLAAWADRHPELDPAFDVTMLAFARHLATITALADDFDHDDIEVRAGSLVVSCGPAVRVTVNVPRSVTCAAPAPTHVRTIGQILALARQERVA